jgi:hypothetical protein
MDDRIKTFYAPDKWEDHSERIAQICEGIEKMTPEQKAWDTLT